MQTTARKTLIVLAAVAALAGANLHGVETVKPEAKAVEPAAAPAEKPAKEAAMPQVTIETSMGTITAELWADKAPATVENFFAYVDGQYYDGLIFHRVIDGFMIQGGGFDEKMVQKQTRPPIKNEASADKRNARGTLAMARTSVVDSATSQFFINLVDNKFLDHRNKTPQGFGYAAFGKVVSGLDVVDKIGKVKTGVSRGQKDVPTVPVVIKSIRRAE